MLMGSRSGPVGNLGDSRLPESHSNPSSRLSPALFGAPEASVISKLHYRPFSLISQVHISILALPYALTPTSIRPMHTPASQMTCVLCNFSFRIATARTTVTIGYALDVGPTRDAFPFSRAYV